MITRNRWTTEEDKVIISHVKNHPENINLGLIGAKEALENRTFSAVQQRYYRIKDKHGVLFLTHSSKKAYVNRKNIATASKNLLGYNIRASIWSKILKLLKLN